MGRLLSAVEAAQLMGVDVRSLYAYVSRGALARAGTDERRRSLYDSDEVELLARRGRPRTGSHPRAGIDVVIGSSVTTLGDGWIRYRGVDVADLVVRRATFEQVAALLWTGHLGEGTHWSLPAPARDMIARVLAPFSPDADVLDRMAAAAAAVNTMLGGGHDADAVGAPLALALVQAVAASGAAAERADAPSVALRLFHRLSPLRPTPARVRTLDRALVLLADHELATSTLAVRVAASTRTSIVGALQAGLGALGGPAHGGAANVVHEALMMVRRGTRAAGDVARAGLGWGHPVHRSGDPRAAPLLEAVDVIAPRRDWSVIQSVLSAASGAPAPNVDCALGALCYVTRMPPRSATAIFAVARSVGWTAHACEELAEQPLRYRARAVARSPAVPLSTGAAREVR